MASLDNYMIQTPIDEWLLLGFLKYRIEQKDFSGLKDKEHYRYQMGLTVVLLYDKFTTIERTKARLLYATAQEAGKQLQIVQQKITNELVCVMILSKLKRPAEEASPIITPPPNLRSPSSTEDNSFNYYYNKETEDASTETSLDEIDAFFQNHSYVAKDVKPSPESVDRRKIQEVKSQPRAEQKDEIVDAGQTLSGESESFVKETKKSEKSKTILSWEHVIDKIKISSNSDHDWLANRYNIFRDFQELQINMIERLKKNSILSYATDVDEILRGNAEIYKLY
ncbi:hypothetical protein RhiirA1_472380 [Rhizophagus irregularis]|uniref:Uncharacterized protein n=1 Tax=Rhizophagus irregularis TaxID=588596 RepID=A0A2I1EZW5_9GLOM|nr:hypothetical protein RhiirA1_472380 [Rhizophagus irregularis]PKY27660.1 hypothetical protein RhiirB3_443449 [Rhizophagus irregularis]